MRNGSPSSVSSSAFSNVISLQKSGPHSTTCICDYLTFSKSVYWSFAYFKINVPKHAAGKPSLIHCCLKVPVSCHEIVWQTETIDVYGSLCLNNPPPLLFKGIVERDSVTNWDHGWIVYALTIRRV
jgi:hypothetical protein